MLLFGNNLVDGRFWNAGDVLAVPINDMVQVVTDFSQGRCWVDGEPAHDEVLEGDDAELPFVAVLRKDGLAAPELPNQDLRVCDGYSALRGIPLGGFVVAMLGKQCAQLCLLSDCGSGVGIRFGLSSGLFSWSSALSSRGQRRHKDVLVFFVERDALLWLWGVVDVV